MFAACDGTGKLPGTNCKMDAFDREPTAPADRKTGQYVYVPHAESQPYFDMAHEWVLADHMFASQLDESFVSHQYIIAAQAQSSVDLPFLPEWGCEGGKRNFVETVPYGPVVRVKPQRACFDYTTLGDELDHAKRSWRFYTSKVVDPADGVWSGYQAVRHIRYGPDWKEGRHHAAETASCTIRRGARSRTSLGSRRPAKDSDHVNCGGGFGPSWVTAVVECDRHKSSFWNDDGDFRDVGRLGGSCTIHVPPPYLDDDGLGFRVPLLVISPYAKQELRFARSATKHGSILKFAEDAFGLPTPGGRPIRAPTLRRCRLLRFHRSRRARSFRFTRPRVRRSSSIEPMTCGRPIISSALFDAAVLRLRRFALRSG